jgi:hypothetical protein
MTLPSAMVNPTVAGDSRSSRSMVAISSSIRSPEAVSAISCTFHLIRQLNPPHNFACSLMAQEIHDFFYADRPGKPVSEGVERMGVELVSISS